MIFDRRFVAGSVRNITDDGVHDRLVSRGARSGWGCGSHSITQEEALQCWDQLPSRVDRLSAVASGLEALWEFFLAVGDPVRLSNYLV